MRRPGGTATLAAAFALLAIAPGAAADDRALQFAAGASEVSAYGGVRVWTLRLGSGRHVLMMQRGSDRARRVPIRSARQRFEPDVGLASGGGVVAIVRRCRTSRACDIHRVDLDTGRERRVRGASSPICNEGGASVWGGTVVFVRRSEGSARRCRARDRLLRTKRGGARRMRSKGVGDSDIDGQWVATHSERTGTRILLEPRSGGKPVTVEAALAQAHAGSIVRAPILDGGNVYYTRILFDTDDGAVRQSIVREAASANPGPATEVATRLADTIAVDAGAVFFTNAFGVFQVQD